MMKNIIPVSDLQRQAGQILKNLNRTSEPVIITQRGRVSAVIISPSHYAQIEEDRALLDDFELAEMLEESRRNRSEGNTLSLDEVKRRLGYPG
jgi:prevent-host-death family protein